MRHSRHCYSAGQIEKEIVIQDVCKELPYCYSKGTFPFEEVREINML